MRKPAQKGTKTNMNSTETITNANTADKAATVAAQGTHAAPEKASPKKGTSPKKGAPKGQKAPKGAKTKTAPPKKAKAAKKAPTPALAKKPGTPRAESKTAKILEMIGRAKGATLAEIMKATGWQPHSVQQFRLAPRVRATTASLEWRLAAVLRRQRLQPVLRPLSIFGLHLTPDAHEVNGAIRRQWAFDGMGMKKRLQRRWLRVY
jgi:uncharacterized protein DUF3489